MARPPRDLEDLPHREPVSQPKGKKLVWAGETWLALEAIRKPKRRRSAKHLAEQRRRRRFHL